MLRFFILTSFIGLFSFVRAQDADTTNCFENFFKSGEKVRNPSKILLTLKNRKVVSITTFLKQQGGMENKMTLKDLDGDGKKELVIYNFTGGAHCCDEFYFFRNTAPDKYVQTAKLAGGNTCITEDTFRFAFTEYLGYFFTCFACTLPDDEEAHNGYHYVDAIELLYMDGKFQIQSGTGALKKIINNNLSIISKLKWDGGASDLKFDDGRRKEVAMNIATYYFSFGKNLTDTRSLFNRYYKFKDAAKVWTALANDLQYIRSQNNL